MPRIMKWPVDIALPQEFLAELKEEADSGEVFVYPTSTLYGLGAGIYSADGVRKVFHLKSRPAGVPMIVMAAVRHIKTMCQITELFQPYMESGDTRITAVLPALPAAPGSLVHRGTLAVRLPCSELTSSLVDVVGPVTSTSANVHGQPTLPDIGAIISQFGERIPVYIDSGRLVNRPTTVIDFTGETPKIIREGALSREEMERIHGR